MVQPLAEGFEVDSQGEGVEVMDKLEVITADICPHGISSSKCDYCLAGATIDFLRKQIADIKSQNKELLARVDALTQRVVCVLTEISTLSYDNDFSTDANGEGIYSHAEIARTALKALSSRTENRDDSV